MTCRTLLGWPADGGTRTSCEYGTHSFPRSPCSVACDVDGRHFSMDCYGPEGFPIRCSCSVDGISIGDGNLLDDDVFYASDCADAATQASNGRCTARLDCCIQFGARFANDCSCGDPVLTNFDSCAEFAAAHEGTVVDLCPRYAPSFP